MKAIERKLINQLNGTVDDIMDEVGTMLPHMRRYITDSKLKTDGLLAMYHVIGVEGIRWVHGHHTYFFEQLCFEMGRIYAVACNYQDSGNEEVSLLGSLLGTLILLEWKDIALDQDGELLETKALGLIKSLTKSLCDDKSLMMAVSSEMRYIYRIYSRDEIFSCGSDRVTVKLITRNNRPLYLVNK